MWRALVSGLSTMQMKPPNPGLHRVHKIGCTTKQSLTQMPYSHGTLRVGCDNIDRSVDFRVYIMISFWPSAFDLYLSFSNFDQTFKMVILAFLKIVIKHKICASFPSNWILQSLIAWVDWSRHQTCNLQRLYRIFNMSVQRDTTFTFIFGIPSEDRIKRCKSKSKAG